MFDCLHQNCLQLTPVSITSLSLTPLKLYAKVTALKKIKGLGLLDVFIDKGILKSDLFQPQLISVLPSLPLSLQKEGNTFVLHCCQFWGYSERRLIVTTSPSSSLCLYKPYPPAHTTGCFLHKHRSSLPGIQWLRISSQARDVPWVVRICSH